MMKSDLLAVGSLNPVDQLAFVIALERFQEHACRTCAIFHRAMDITQGRAAVNGRLTHTQHVEVWPLKDENTRPVRRIRCS